MVIQADGEKYACDACVRGHRVSSCTHKDRHLNHINKKGRPVSQCPHCRTLRKNRASHVKCVCAEVGLTRPESDIGACHCMNGQKCTCAAKREAIANDNFPKVAALNTTTTHRRSQSKPNMANRRSDSVVPKHQNGHHPPLHRFNHAAHDYAPYPVKRSQTTNGSMHIGQRSVDNLSLSMHSTGSGMYSTSPSSLPMPSYVNNAAGLGGNNVTSASVPSGLNNLAGPNTFAENITYGPNTRWSMTDFSNMSSYPSFANEQYGAQDPMSAMSDQQFNWSDWDFNAASAPEGIQQAGSVASIDHPGLSRSSSGTASDTGESSFNPGDVSFPNIPLPGVGSNGAAWSLNESWPVDAPGLQDKTPIAMPSRSTGSGPGMELNDYFGDFTQNVDFRSAPVTTGESASYPAPAYEGSMTGMAMPTMSPQNGSTWAQSPQPAQIKVESQARGATYHDQSWL